LIVLSIFAVTAVWLVSDAAFVRDTPSVPVTPSKTRHLITSPRSTSSEDIAAHPEV
jgi:hypothetical protein